MKGVHIQTKHTHVHIHITCAFTLACVRGDIAPLVRTRADLLSHVALAAGRPAENTEAAGGAPGARQGVRTQKYVVTLDYYE